MLLDRWCQSGWGTQKQHTDRLTRHKHAAFHLPPSLACLSSPPCKLSTVLCIRIQNDEGSETSAWRQLYIYHKLFEIVPGWASFAKQFDNKSKILSNFKLNLIDANWYSSAVCSEKELRMIMSNTLCMCFWHGLFAGLALHQCNVMIALARQEQLIYMRGDPTGTHSLPLTKVPTTLQ